MRSLILIFLLILGLASVSAAQTEPKAYKFAEFGPLSQAGVKTKLQSFVLALANDPTAKGYIIDYGTPKAIAARRTQLTRSYTWLKLDPSRITFVDGPPEKKIRTFMWIVPPGASPPTP